MAKIIGIAICEKKGADMVVFESAAVSTDRGIGDDHHGADMSKIDRQVTIMTQKNWDLVCSELNTRLHWTMRHANLIIDDIDLENSTGSILKIGNFYLEITGEFKAGKRMDDQYQGLKKALSTNWRGGVTAKVLQNGVVKEYDEVLIGDRT